MNWFKNKRTQIAKALPKNSVLILSGAPEYYRQDDVKYPYQQDSHFYYLTGFEQENSLFLLFPSGRSVLFLEDQNPIKEIWEGSIYSTKEVKTKFLIDEAYPLSEIEHKLPRLLKNKSVKFYNQSNPFFDKKIYALSSSCRSAKEFLKDFRRIKDKTEIKWIKEAISASTYAHKQVAKALKPGINERALHGIFIKSIMEKNSPREAYGSIVACKDNATTLHYTKNNSVCKKGDLLLLDAGAQSHYYSADITRVYPVNGRFSKSQKQLYKPLLNLQKNLIQAIRPDISLKQINKQMCEGITRLLLELNWLKGSVKENMKKKSYEQYCPHSVGHLLGIDVHDVSFTKTEKSILKPGMVLTIEPGIYISQKNKTVAPQFRGVGLRIEDDILVTTTGYKNLTQQMPKELDEIEQLCQS